jgi:hypothetical protein
MTKYTTYFFILYVFVTVVLLAGCYKDKGNYDYQKINEVVLKTDTDTVTVILPAALKVNLSLQQTMPGNEGFTFEWVLYQQAERPPPAEPLAQLKTWKPPLQNCPARIT